MHLRQTEAGALADRFGREERIEHLRRDVVRNSDTGIFDGYRDLIISRNVFRPDRDFAAFGHRVTRIDGQVDQRRFELVRIHQDVPDILRNIGNENNLASETAIENLPERIEALGQFNRLWLNVLPAGEGQQLTGE